MSQPSPPNPYAELAVAWERFKRAHATAVQELKRSYQCPEPAIRDYRFGQATAWDTDSRNEWYKAIQACFGRQVHVEWVGDGKHPACIVNHVMMFS